MKKLTFSVFTMTLLVGMVFNTSLFAVTHTVQVGSYYFNPSTLNVNVGDIVEWVWVQGSHTTTSSSAPAGTTNFSVTSNSSWTASSDETWCTVTSSGSGNGTLVANYNENTTTSSRTATISVSISGLSPVTVQVIQDGSAVGIPESNVSSIHLFPNPAKDVVKISLNNGSGNTRVSLVDLTGKIIFDRSVPDNNEVSLKVGDLPRGYYFVKIFLKNETITRRVILAE